MRTTVIRYLLMTGMLIACGDGPADFNKSSEDADIDSTELGLVEPNYVTNPREKRMTAIADTIFNGDTLIINFKTPHPKDFAITTPDDHFFFVVYQGNDTTMPSLVDANKFAERSTLAIITNQTKANPWDARINENQLIFTKTGKYELRLSDNLETDDGTPVEIDSVYFIDRLRGQ